MEHDTNEECEEEMSVEEMSEENNFVLNALIDLLVEKKIISEEEFKEKLEAMEAELYDTEDSDDGVEEE